MIELPAGAVVLAVFVAVLAVTFWRLVLWLLVVALVALGLVGLLALVARPAQAAIAVDAAGVSATAGDITRADGADRHLLVIALVVVLGTVFVLGLLIGQQWRRREMRRRDRELVRVRRSARGPARADGDRETTVVGPHGPGAAVDRTRWGA